MHTVILGTILTLSTNDPQIVRVAMDRSQDSVHVFAYDEVEELAAEIVLWLAPDEGYIHVDANFPDGVYLATTLSHDEIIAIDNNDPEVTVARLTAVLDVLGEVEQASWWKSAGYAAITAIEATKGSVLALPSAVLAFCECLPEFIELAGGEWEGCF
jgi:hypothetical protein